MYVIHPHSRLAPFYSVYTQNQWRLNPENLTYIAQICSNYSLEVPTNLNLATLDQYVNERAALNPDLSNLVVTELYHNFSIVGGASPMENRNHQIWVNFIHYMSERLISNMWNRLPEYKRVEETLDLLRTPTLVEPSKLFNSFNPEYDRDLLNGIERWTYIFLRNSISSKIRERDQFFGLSNLGVVSKSTKLSIRKAISSQICTELEGLSDYNLKDRLIIDPFLVDIYKSYLKRTQIRTNNLVVQDWEEINRQIENKWSELDLDLPPPSIEKIQEELKIVGNYVRNAEINVTQPKIQQRNTAWDRAYHQLLIIIKQTIPTLDPCDLELLELRYRERLLQEEISLRINRDQTSVSRQLLNIHKIILKTIYQQISHPEDEDIPVNKIDKIAIRALKQALRELYSEFETQIGSL